MEFKTFIGIDISKETIDVAIRVKSPSVLLHEKFSNKKKGFSKMLSWIKKQTKTRESEILFCMEHTGIYTLPIACFLSEKNLSYHLENPYHLKHSMGIKRGKNDKVDSTMIARYAYLHHEELKLTEFPSMTLVKLQSLLSHRERLIKTRTTFTVAPKSLSEFTSKDIHEYIVADSADLIESINEKVKQVENEIEQLIRTNEDIKKNYELVKSVKGVGMVIAAYMIICTQNFTSIRDSRSFASYSGIAPFEHKSGTSINGSPHVSHLANKKMKSLLNNGAWSAVKFDKEIKTYYNRKIEEGKHELCVINAVRNKLVGRIFATVKRQTPYVELCNYASI